MARTKLYVRIKRTVVDRTYAVAELPTKGIHAYLLAEWGAYSWTPNRNHATAFANSERAWEVFERTGCGRQEDYEIEEVLG